MARWIGLCWWSVLLAWGAVETPSLESLQPGLVMEIYHGQWRKLPDFDALTPRQVRISPSLALTKAEKRDHIAVRFRGYLLVPADGNYRFGTRSDDGSRLWIGETLVVDNDGLHGKRDREGRIALRAGYHPMTVGWFNRKKSPSFRAWWTGGTGGAMAFGADQLFHQVAGGTADAAPVEAVGQPPRQHPLAHWPFDQTAADISGHHRRTGLRGGARITGPGRIGLGSLLLDGRSGCAEVVAFDLGAAFTIAGWIRLDRGRDNIQTIVASAAQGEATPGFKIFVNSWQTNDRAVIIETGNGRDDAKARTEPGAVTAETWHHIAVVVNRVGGTARLFIDGVDKTERQTIRDDFPTDRPLAFGRMHDSHWFGGSLDDWRVYPGLLGSSEVRHLSVGASSAVLPSPVTDRRSGAERAPTVPPEAPGDGVPPLVSGLSFAQVVGGLVAFAGLLVLAFWRGVRRDAAELEAIVDDLHPNDRRRSTSDHRRSTSDRRRSTSDRRRRGGSRPR